MFLKKKRNYYETIHDGAIGMTSPLVGLKVLQSVCVHTMDFVSAINKQIKIKLNECQTKSVTLMT